MRRLSAGFAKRLHIGRHRPLLPERIVTALAHDSCMPLLILNIVCTTYDMIT